MNYRDCFVDVLCDLQFGSTGKGAVAGYLARENRYDTSIAVNMTNAGHTFIDENGNRFVQHVLPSSAASSYMERVLIGPGSVFKIEDLGTEVDALWKAGYHPRVMIHENAWVWDNGYADAENSQMLGSTRSGAGIAQVAKMARGNGWDDNRAKFNIGDLPDNCYIIKHRDWRTLIESSRRVLLEGSQGYGLSLNSGFYPYVTSRDCTPARFLSDAMIPFDAVNHVYGVMRVYPIRVAGDSGPWYPGQIETSWEALDLTPEFTTVTKKERRVAHFSYEQIEEAVWHCRPQRVVLTHCDQNQQVAEDIEHWFNHKFEPYSWMSHKTWGPTVNDVEPLEKEL